MPTAEELSIETPNLRLAAKAWGPPDGMPVIALHGWLDNAATWDHLAPLMPELRLIAVDSPGHGRSQHRTEAPYHFIDYVAETLHVIEALTQREGESFANPVVMGHSMGAGIVALLAGARADKVRAAILVEGLGPLSEEPEVAVKRLGKAVVAERRRAYGERKGKTVHPTKDAAAERVAKVAGMEVSSARTLVERGLVRTEGGFEWSADARLRTHSRQYLTEDVVHAYLSAASCPSLLIKATHGWPFDLKKMEARMQAMGSEDQPVKLVELDGGHHLHLDVPQSVADTLRSFLQSL